MSIYLDNAATTYPKPECVYEAVNSFMRFNGSNARRGNYRRALESEDKRPFYAPEKKVLHMRKDTKIILLGNNEVSMTKLQNITDAYYELDLLKNIINETYERRDEITPIYETRKLPGVIEVYKLLPKTNCKKCGEPSCLALATKLSTYQVDETQCPELFLEANAELKTATKGAVAK